ncbi:unnamed protein product [Prorocentrum cordatum]|uniref:Uncharacterized protein n=1 Tax=Prorocentrum cordatum TaxID=2364126 RepID=A0ABN9S1N8_9DINO|nr:unnamed protein product [Polarella glacialis]
MFQPAFFDVYVIVRSPNCASDSTAGWSGDRSALSTPNKAGADALTLHRLRRQGCGLTFFACRSYKADNAAQYEYCSTKAKLACLNCVAPAEPEHTRTAAIRLARAS